MISQAWVDGLSYSTFVPERKQTKKNHCVTTGRRNKVGQVEPRFQTMTTYGSIRSRSSKSNSLHPSWRRACRCLPVRRRRYINLKIPLKLARAENHRSSEQQGVGSNSYLYSFLSSLSAYLLEQPYFTMLGSIYSWALLLSAASCTPPSHILPRLVTITAS